MKISKQVLFGLLMMSIGAVKTWLHINTLSTLAIPTCNGQILQIPLNDSATLYQLHCWGCYLVAAGVAVISFSIYRLTRGVSLSLHGQIDPCSMPITKDG